MRLCSRRVDTPRLLPPSPVLRQLVLAPHLLCWLSCLPYWLSCLPPLALAVWGPTTYVTSHFTNTRRFEAYASCHPRLTETYASSPVTALQLAPARPAAASAPVAPCLALSGPQTAVPAACASRPAASSPTGGFAGTADVGPRVEYSGAAGAAGADRSCGGRAACQAPKAKPAVAAEAGEFAGIRERHVTWMGKRASMSSDKTRTASKSPSFMSWTLSLPPGSTRSRPPVS